MNGQATGVMKYADGTESTVNIPITDLDGFFHAADHDVITVYEVNEAGDESPARVRKYMVTLLGIIAGKQD